MTLALTVRISVFGRPVVTSSGTACLYRSQSRNESASCDSVDLGAAAEMPAVGGCPRSPRSPAAAARARPSTRLPARRQRARHPIGVQPRPGAVGDDRVQAGVQRVDQRLVLLGDRVCHEIVQAERVFDDLCGIAGLHGPRLLRRRHPGIDLTRFYAGVQGVEVGKLHRLEMQGVDDVGLFDGALNDADALAGGQFVEAGDRRSGRHDQGEIPEVVSVGEPDGAPARFGGGDR